jgi:2'-5' RNA ligase
MLKMYTAVKVKSSFPELNNGHLTLSFSDVKETEKLCLKTLSDFFPSKATISEIVFFDKAGVTVALVNSQEIISANNYLNSIGMEYDMDFKPHVTLSYGGENKVEFFSHLINKEIEFDEVYLKIKNFNKG